MKLESKGLRSALRLHCANIMSLLIWISTGGQLNATLNMSLGYVLTLPHNWDTRTLSKLRASEFKKEYFEHCGGRLLRTRMTSDWRGQLVNTNLSRNTNLTAPVPVWQT